MREVLIAMREVLIVVAMWLAAMWERACDAVKVEFDSDDNWPGNGLGGVG